MLRKTTIKLREFVIDFDKDGKEIESDKYYGFNSDDARKGEMPSCGTYANARSLGKLAAFMANGGSLKGQTLLSKDAWDRFHSGTEIKSEGLFENRSIFT